jgi:hypothetical protein
MACYAYSVLTRWFSSVHSGAESRSSSDLMAKQVVIASSVTPMEFNDRSPLPTTFPTSYLHLDKKRGKSYSVKTIGGTKSDSTWSYIDEYNTPMLQNLV